MLDGEKAYLNLRDLVGKTSLPNLFSTHPSFQIDGNFGGAAGVAEMLLQSHNNAIHLLPAIPKAWSTGSFRGLKARGDFVINAVWENEKIQKLHVFSAEKAKVNIVFGSENKVVNLNKGNNDLSSLFL